MSPHRVLLTGSSGFIGSYTVRELAESGHEVVGIDLQEPRDTAAWVQGEAGKSMPLEIGSVDQWGSLVNAIEKHKPTAIIHLASLVRPDLLEREPFTALRLNVVSSINCFEAARIFGIERVVYISSIGVFPPRRYTPLDANHPIFTATEATPDTFYGAAKISSEAFAFAYHHALDLDVLIVRPSAVYGFGMQWPIYIRPMVENSLRGEPTRFDSGADMPRDYAHAADVAQLIRRCVEIDRETVHDRIFHGGTGEEPVTAGQVAQVVRELVPAADIEIGPGIPDEEQRDATTRARFDMTAAHEQLGFTPRFSDIRDGIADYIEQFHKFERRQVRGDS
jgi:nucleoside-diphosphate-sugar epimerase